MEVIRFKKSAILDYYCGCGGSGEFCKADHSGEYYGKPETDAVIARLQADLFQAQAKSSRLEARCGDLQDDVERLTESLRACAHELQEPTNAKEEILRVAKQALSGGR